MAILPTIQSNQQQGSGFTNLQSILQANQKNRLGQAVSSGITDVGQRVKGDLAQTNQDFTQQTTAAQQNLNQNQAYVKGILGAPDQIAGITDQDVSKFANIEQGQYTGPSSIDSTGLLGAQAQAAQALGQYTTNPGGRVGLLQRFASTGPKYTAGQQTLDSLLLGQGSNADQLRKARQSVAGVGDQYTGMATAAGQVAQGLQSQSEGLAADTISGIGQNVSDYDKQMQAQAATLQAAQTAKQQKAVEDLKQGKATQDIMKLLGLTEGEQIYNTDFSNVLTPTQIQAQAETVQTDKDFAKIQALNRLANNKLSGDPSALVQKYNVAANVNSFQNTPAFLTPGAGEAQAAIDAQAQQYNYEIEPFRAIYEGQTAVKNSAYRGAANQAVTPTLNSIQKLYDSGYRDNVITDKLMGDIKKDPSSAADILGQAGLLPGLGNYAQNMIVGAGTALAGGGGTQGQIGVKDMEALGIPTNDSRFSAAHGGIMYSQLTPAEQYKLGEVSLTRDQQLDPASLKALEGQGGAALQGLAAAHPELNLPLTTDVQDQALLQNEIMRNSLNNYEQLHYEPIRQKYNFYRTLQTEPS